MSYFRVPLGIALLISTFVAGVLIRDYLHERYLKANVSRIQPGMSSAEVTAILGPPTSKHISDIPGVCWCFGSDSFESHEEYCGKVSIEMSRDGHVVAISPVIR